MLREDVYGENMSNSWKVLLPSGWPLQLSPCCPGQFSHCHQFTQEFTAERGIYRERWGRKTQRATAWPIMCAGSLAVAPTVFALFHSSLIPRFPILPHLPTLNSTSLFITIFIHDYNCYCCYYNCYYSCCRCVISIFVYYWFSVCGSCPGNERYLKGKNLNITGKRGSYWGY